MRLASPYSCNYSLFKRSNRSPQAIAHSLFSPEVPRKTCILAQRAAQKSPPNSSLPPRSLVQSPYVSPDKAENIASSPWDRSFRWGKTLHLPDRKLDITPSDASDIKSPLNLCTSLESIRLSCLLNSLTSHPLKSSCQLTLILRYIHLLPTTSKW